jgi:arylsulfatase A-like enzyme
MYQETYNNRKANYNNFCLGQILLLLLVIFLSCLGAECKTGRIKEGLPNIIVILVDDAGYIDFGFMGSDDLETPHIDKIARRGTVFTDAHVTASVCAPSRAGLITGQYQQRFGFEANGTGGIGLSDEVSTIADIFQKNEYATYAIGKWHLGESLSDHPNKRGFDEFYGFIGGSRSYFPIENPDAQLALQNNGNKTSFEGYLTDALGNKAVDYIKSAQKPIFMYLAFNAVHTPMEAKEVDLEKFNNHPRQILAAMTWSLDENIGKVIKALEEKNELENTMIFFLSDNGGAHSNDSKTGPLKAWKGYKFEGGHRVPFVVSWPGKLPQGNNYKELTSSLDILPTATAAAKIKIPDSHHVDGVNLLPFLLEEEKGAPHKTLFWRKLDVRAARIGNFKFIELEGYGSVLYNLENDLGETIDLSGIDSTQKIAIEMVYRNWETNLIPPKWIEGKNWMDVNRHVHQSLMQNKVPRYKDPNQHRKYLEQLEKK